MSTLTRNGVYLDLTESTYVYEYDNLCFYFSSNVYLKKFKENVDLICELDKINFNNKYKCDILNSKLFAINYYKKVEKRGCYIVDKLTKNKIKILQLNLEV